MALVHTHLCLSQRHASAHVRAAAKGHLRALFGSLLAHEAVGVEARGVQRVVGRVTRLYSPTGVLQT